VLSEVGLNIREAHVFSTSDGLCLHIFLVDGWHTEVKFEHYVVVYLFIDIYFFSMFC
jgi:hypothetical protein